MSKQPRRKGNVRASSSARAAQMLNVAAGQTPLIGFDAFSAESLGADELLQETHDSLDPRAHNALRKLAKKDALTKEKGLKEIASLLAELDQLHIEKAFAQYVPIFPNVCLEETTSIRSLSLVVLEKFINILKKGCEKFIKTVMPYVLFSQQDSFAQVAQSANTLIEGCFPEPKLSVLLDLCASETCEIALQMLEKSHPLLSETEEAVERRLCRLRAQSLSTLRVFAERCPKEMRSRVLNCVCDRLVVENPSTSPQVSNALFSLASKLVTLEWAGVFDSRLFAASLGCLDCTDRSLCLSAANFFLTVAEVDSTFAAVNVQDAVVISKIISIVKRKEIHWSNLGMDMIRIVEVVLDRISPPEQVQLLLRLFEASFLGIPWAASFDKKLWNVFVLKLCDFLFSRFPFKGFNEGHILADQLISKLLWAVNTSASDLDSVITRTVSSVLLRFLELQERDEGFDGKLFASFREQLFTNLVNLLPRSNEMVCDLLKGLKDSSGWMELTLMLCRGHSYVRLIPHIVESASKAQIVRILHSEHIPLLQLLHDDYFKGCAEDPNSQAPPQIMRALLKVADVGGEKLDAVFDSNELESDSVVMHIVEGALSNVDASTGSRVLSLSVWNSVVVRAARVACQSFSPMFSRILSVISVPSVAEELVTKLLDEDDLKSTTQLSVIVKQLSKMTSLECRKKTADVFIHSIFSALLDSQDICLATCVEAILSLDIHAGFFANFFENCYQRDEFSSNDVEALAAIAFALKPEYQAGIVVGEVEAFELLSKIDAVFGMEILSKNEFLCSPAVSRVLVSNAFDGEPILRCAIARASTLLEFAQRGDRLRDDDLLLPSVYYSTAVSCLVNFLATEGFTFTSPLGTRLNNRALSLVFHNENFRHHLLWKLDSIGISAMPLAGLLAVRSLSEGMHMDPIQKHIRSLIAHEDIPSACALACATRLKLPEVGVTDFESWTCRLEMLTASRDVDSSLALFSSLTAISNSKAFCLPSEGEEDRSLYVANCRLLRSLAFCCSRLFTSKDESSDFACCGVITALTSCKEFAPSGPDSWQLALFGTLTLRFFVECVRVSESSQGVAELAEFREEWSDFFGPSSESMVLQWFLSTAKEHRPLPSVLARALTRSIHYCSEESFRSVAQHLPASFDASLDSENFPAWIQSLMAPLSDALSHQLLEFRLSALPILKFILREVFIIENKAEGGGASEESEEKLTTSTGKVIPSKISVWLESVDVTCIIVWDALVSCLGDMEISSRAAYCNSMSDSVSHVMRLLFNILPQNPNVEDFRLSDDELLRSDVRDPNVPLIDEYAFGVFYRSFATLPTLVRRWYASLPRAMAATVSKYTSKYITPLVWKKERTSILAHQTSDHIKIRALEAVREIVIDYEMEDARLLVTVGVPADYPLGPPSANSETPLLQRELNKRWLIQLNLFLCHQNGDVVDSIAMWTRNIDKHFGGAEECTICMMVVHSVTSALPRVKCKQCKKKFHSDCLHKWFKTSKKPTCPLCRNVFGEK